MKNAFKFIFAIFLSLGLLVACNTEENETPSVTMSTDDLNDDIASLNTLLRTMNAGEYIMDIEPLIQGEETVGTIISFTDGTRCQFHKEYDIPYKTPSLFVKQDGDVLYWSLDGIFLRDDSGSKMRVGGEQGDVVPAFKIEKNYWHISVDNKQTWRILQEVVTGEALVVLNSLEQEGKVVSFSLQDGTTILGHKVPDLVLRFNVSDDVPVFPGQTVEVGYTISDAVRKVTLNAAVTGDWTAEVRPESDTEGILVITAPDPVTSGKVTLTASNSVGQSASAEISVTDGVLEIVQNAYTVLAEESTVKVNVRTNVAYEVVIRDKGNEWITVPSSKAQIREEEVVLSISRNPSSEDRSATVAFCDAKGYTIKEISIHQKGARMELQQKVLTFSDECGEQKVTFKSYADWTVFSTEDWLTVSPSSGTASFEDQELTLSCSANPGEERTGRVTFSVGVSGSAYIDVTQAKQKALLDLDTESLNFPREGSSQSINLISYYDWTASCEEPWISISPSSGVGAEDVRKEITITAGSNSDSGRTATIVFTNQATSKSITVTQDGLIDISCADFCNLADDNGKLYRLTGKVSGKIYISDGRFDLSDASGSTYVFKCTNWQDFKYSVYAGSEVTVYGNKSSYEGKAEMHNTVIQHATPGDPERPSDIVDISLSGFCALADDAVTWYRIPYVECTNEKITNFATLDFNDGNNHTMQIYAPDNYYKFASEGSLSGNVLSIVGHKETYNGMPQMVGGYIESRFDAEKDIRVNLSFYDGTRASILSSGLISLEEDDLVWVNGKRCILQKNGDNYFVKAAFTSDGGGYAIFYAGKDTDSFRDFRKDGDTYYSTGCFGTTGNSIREPKFFAYVSDGSGTVEAYLEHMIAMMKVAFTNQQQGDVCTITLSDNWTGRWRYECQTQSDLNIFAQCDNGISSSVSFDLSPEVSEYYVAIPPALTTSSLSLQVKANEGTVVAEKTSSKSRILERGKLYSLGTIDCSR